MKCFRFSKLKISIFFFIIICYIIETSCYAYCDTGQLNQVKSILILQSYYKENYKFNKISDVIKDTLSERYTKITYNFEYLELDDSRDLSYINTKANYLKSKYQNHKFDLIIVLNDESIDFVANYYEDLFKDTPVVFGSLNNTTKLNSYPYNLFLGIAKESQLDDTLHLISNLHPETKQINILLNANIYSQSLPDEVSLLKEHFSNIKLNSICSDYIEDVISKIDPSNSNEVNLIAGHFKNKRNIYLSPKETVEKLKQSSTLPIYTLRNIYIGIEGVIGGKIYNPDEQGEQIGNLALKILMNENLSSMPLLYDNSSKYTFNYDELIKFDINMKDLPEGSIILNKPLNSFNMPSEIKPLILGLICTFLLITMFQSINTTRLRKKSLEDQQELNEIIKYDRIKTEFLANISHELRAPLNVMLAGLQLLELYEKSGDIVYKNERAKNKISYINQNGLILLRIINNLIDITKLDAGFLNLKLENINIVEVVENIALSTIDYVENKNISLIFDTEEEEIYTAVDYDKIERVVLNLLSNAIKFTKSGGSIAVNVKLKEDNVLIIVQDTGIGIPKDKQTSIFERFTQIDNSLSRGADGSGIGLSIVKSIVELHNGKIYVDSEVNKGSTFTIELPITTLENSTIEVDKDFSSNIVTKVNLEFSDLYKEEYK
ncbi:sensor histidine kinase [Clostridium sp. UBA6640]|uniref:sensor histidine kinase n=1 Tax=Clostridium sp. UBA6640 TaxID=1946370 RepID=UPI0025C29FA1|nr:ABC transporter substrate binding protein [Clostridium sp. UBA6640]